MARQISICFTTEGATDVRFLTPVIQRTFEEIAFECEGEIDVLPVHHKAREKGQGIIKGVEKVAKFAEEHGFFVLCVHVDADSSNDQNVLQHQINPSFEHIRRSNDIICKNLVAIIPVQMTEAWMLADKSLLKDEIGTEKSDNELRINRPPETYSNPKNIIEEAIRIAFQDESQRKRRKFGIGELYTPLGQKLAIEKLENLPSFNKFKDSVRQAFRNLNYLQ